MLRPFSLMTLLSTALAASVPSAVPPWAADLGDGTYRNPVLYADYSDPDAIRVGDDYWLVSSSFSHVPGLPILHSRDLVNWSLVGHALPRLVPETAFATPQPGKGVWAPAIRHHAGRFWIYYPDPDFGLYVLTANDPRGPWSAPTLVKTGRGLIDPCPLWDDDGSLYLIHGWAHSRAGFANVLSLLRLSADGTRVEADLGILIDGHKVPGCTTLEGPKLYRRNGWYYVFAPAGGVKQGWQSVFRARALTGPYEHRIVLAQGTTPINGPHQGALVDTPTGEEWFLHFQDQHAYGRVVHLQPVVWKNDWPIIGNDPDGDGTGEPVLVHRKPDVGPALVCGEPVESAFGRKNSHSAAAAGQRQPDDPSLPVGAARVAPPLAAIPTSDEFASPQLGLQWQWQANPHPEWLSLTARPGWLRLFAQPVANGNLYHAAQLLLQKLPAPAFTVTTKLDFARAAAGDAAGLIVFGYDYAWLGVRDGKLVHVVVKHAHQQPVRTETPLDVAVAGPCFLRLVVREGAHCEFSHSTDGRHYAPIGAPFVANVSRWVGAKMGLFAAGPGCSAADWEFFRVEPAGSR